MDWVIVILLLALITFVWIGLKKILEQFQRLEIQIKSVNLALRARQTQVRMNQTSQAAPRVDARARTTVRDTKDLPATARQSVAVHRKKTNGRADNDS